MKLLQRYVFVAVFLFVSVCGILVADTIIVTVPPETPNGDSIFIAGNIPLFGKWQANGKKLQKIDNITFRLNCRLPRGQKIEFKCTRGTFGSVEKAKDGAERPNRQLILKDSRDRTIKIRVESWADQVVPPATDPGDLHITGRFVLFPDVPSQFLRHPRDVIVVLPRGYYQASQRQRRYPVMYMHDGQNLFDPATSFLGQDWMVDEAMQELLDAQKIEPTIVVGIANSADRNTEYTPFKDPKHGGGGGEWYGRFLVEELKPFIDERFRTKPD